MPSGVEMMMKALGLDPAEIRAQMERPIAEIIRGINTLSERLGAIDTRLTRIEQALQIPIVETKQIEITGPTERRRA